MSKFKKLILISFLITTHASVTFAQSNKELSVRAINLSKEVYSLGRGQQDFDCIDYYMDGEKYLDFAAYEFIYGTNDKAMQYLLKAQGFTKNAFDNYICIKKNETQEINEKIKNLFNDADNMRHSNNS